MSKDKQPKDPAEQGKEIKTAADLKQDENNYRKHSDTNKARIKKSIDEAGLGRSVVVDADGVLVAGNGVQQVIDPETPVRVVETDGTELVVVKRTDLHIGDPRRKTLALADNATADDVEWDFEAIEADGWTEESAGGWGVEWPADEEEGKQQEAHEDDFDPDSVTETVCKKGDIWKLGNHRLMCGDSTDAGSVALLMDGEKADIAFTSPPYNAGNIGQDGNKSTMKKYREFDDNKTMDDYFKFVSTNIECLLNVSEEIFYNIGLVSGNKVAIFKLINEYIDNFKDIIYWEKNTSAPMIQQGCINNLVEFIICFGHNNSRKFANPQFSQGTYWNVIKGKGASGNEYADIHKATFPMYLPENIISNFTSERALVLDCFGGTGTTMIAAEQLNRKCYMMELDPHYCDVIIARWEKLTGNKAEKLK